ncbi:MAG: pyridoxal phosphate-dependent aminotransferase [Polyangiaceae bacterium]|nr:pyridoxal phosphate-dependent aminotransferase [Myxococcales bacterium]MCB9587759.1 pyridoxal phosphate-dependent aminotransferase [Polyangiaceae bacterium]
MLPTIDYLEYAIRHFGKTPFDLASSGAPPVQASELGYEAADDPEARQRFLWAIAGRYQVPVEALVPALGASGALFAVCQGLLKPGDCVAVEEPGYEPLWRIPEALGARVVRFPRGEDVGAMLDHLGVEPRLVIVSNPHNPTAAVLSDEQLVAFANGLEGRYLLVDEVYRELAMPVSTAFGKAPNLITVSSTTKCLGVPWARAGWIAAPGELVSAFRRSELFSVGNAPPGCFAWGAAAVEQATWLLERVTKLQRGKRALVDTWTASQQGWLTAHPGFEQSLFVWLERRDGANLMPWLETLRDEAGITISPGQFFGAPQGMRLSFTLVEDALVEALGLLGERAPSASAG